MVKSVLRRKTIKPDREKLCQAVLEAAETAGKQFGDQGIVSYLQAQAIATPSPFLTLLSKVLADDRDMVKPRITRIEIVTPQPGRSEPQTDSREES